MDLKLWKLLWDRYGVLLESKTLGDLEKMKQSGLLGNLIKGIRLDEEKSYD